MRCDVHWARLGALAPGHLALLDDVELARRVAYVRQGDRARFTLGAVLLRTIVAARTGAAPGDVEIDRTCASCGKPHGRPLAPGSGLHLSVAHSGDVAAVAVSDAGPVGIDLEALRQVDHEPLLGDVLAPEERGGEVDVAAFFTVWTRKEAVLKATGDGLSVPMRELVVSSPAQAPRLVRYPGAPDLRAQMTDLPLPGGYAGAAAVLAAHPVTFRTHDATALLT